MRPHDEDNQQIWSKLTEAGEFDMAGQTGLGPLDDKPDPELSRVPYGQGVDRDDSINNWENSDALADMLHRELTDLWRDEIEGTDMGDLPPDQLRQEKESLKAFISKFIDEQLPDSPKEQRPR
jgi:hypothetical protein